MKIIWKTINRMKVNPDVKIRLFLFVTTVIFAVSGAAVWYIFGKRYCSEIIWLFCFAGYPAVIGGLVGGTFYLFNHEFR